MGNVVITTHHAMCVLIAHNLMYGQQVCDVSPYHTLAIALHLRVFFTVHANFWTKMKG